MKRSAFEADVDHGITLCLRYSWSEHEIVRELEKLRGRYAPEMKAAHAKSV